VGEFDLALANELVAMSALNRDIQQKLKPRFVLREISHDGNSEDEAQATNVFSVAMSLPTKQPEKPPGGSPSKGSYLNLG
jgi:hypothetical protein